MNEDKKRLAKALIRLMVLKNKVRETKCERDEARAEVAIQSAANGKLIEERDDYREKFNFEAERNTQLEAELADLKATADQRDIDFTLEFNEDLTNRLIAAERELAEWKAVTTQAVLGGWHMEDNKIVLNCPETKADLDALSEACREAGPKLPDWKESMPELAPTGDLEERFTAILHKQGVFYHVDVGELVAASKEWCAAQVQEPDGEVWYANTSEKTLVSKLERVAYDLELQSQYNEAEVVRRAVIALKGEK